MEKEFSRKEPLSRIKTRVTQHLLLVDRRDWGLVTVFVWAPVGGIRNPSAPGVTG